MYLHLDLATLADLAGTGRTGPVSEERFGVASTDLIRDWLTEWRGEEAKVVVKPVLDRADPDAVGAVDGHDPTARFPISGPRPQDDAGDVAAERQRA